MSTMIIKFSFLTKEGDTVSGVIRDVPMFDTDLSKSRPYRLLEAWTGDKIHELLEFESYSTEEEAVIKQIHASMNAA